MKKPKKLFSWDFPDTCEVPDGYDWKSVPEATRNNFNVLIEHHNKLVEVVNRLLDTAHVKLVFEDEDDE